MPGWHNAAAQAEACRCCSCVLTLHVLSFLWSEGPIEAILVYESHTLVMQPLHDPVAHCGFLQHERAARATKHMVSQA